MPCTNLTAELVRDLPFMETGQTFYRDTKLTGFGVKVGKASKTYFVERRVKGRVRRVILDPTNMMTVLDARKVAQKTLVEMLSGSDPNKRKAEERANSLTLRKALDLYLTDHDLKSNTAKENRRLILTDFPDWMDMDLKSISPSMVVKRFDQITERSATVANHACWVLRAVLNYARIITKSDAGEYILPPNPCQRLTDLRRFHKSKARTGRLTDQQFPAFFKALEDSNTPTFATYMELLVRTGLRRTEAASLCWADVNMSAKTFTIPAGLSKNGKALTLPMSRQIEKLFQRRREAAPEAVKGCCQTDASQSPNGQ
jgi:integrase